MDTTRESAASSVQNETNNFTNKTRDSISSEMDHISNEYRSIESKYQSIVKELSKKNKKLMNEISSNKAIVESTKQLERELQANELVLKSTKSELDIAECKLEKVCILERQRESDLNRVRVEMEAVEVKNEKLEILVADRNRAIGELEKKVLEGQRLLSKSHSDLQKTQISSEQQIAAMRKEMHSQCIEMQEDVTVLSGRLQEMAAISEELKSTKCELKETKKEATILSKSVLDLKDKLCHEIAKNENLSTDLKEVQSLNSCLESEKMKSESELCNLNEQCMRLNSELEESTREAEDYKKSLKEVRMSNFENMEKVKEQKSVVSEMTEKMKKYDFDLKNMHVMYKEKVDCLNTKTEEINSLKTENSEMKSQIQKLQAENEILNAEKSKISNDNEKTEVNVCALQIKIKQLTEDQLNFVGKRKSLENELAEQSSKLEQAEHDLKRSVRKFEFSQDELEQLKAQFDKERSKFEQAMRDSIQLQDQVSFLRSESDSLKIQLQEAESRNERSLSKSDRMKEKIKIYQKNLSEAHGEEMSCLNQTIRDLTEKLQKKEKELRKVKISENQKSVATEKPASQIAPSPGTDKKNLAEINKKLEKLEKEQKNLQSELDRTLNTDVNVVEKRKRTDEAAEDDNKENIDPNGKKNSSKKLRVVLGEKTNVQVPVKNTRSTRAKRGINKTMM